MPSVCFRLDVESWKPKWPRRKAIGRLKHRLDIAELGGERKLPSSPLSRRNGTVEVGGNAYQFLLPGAYLELTPPNRETN